MKDQQVISTYFLIGIISFVFTIILMYYMHHPNTFIEWLGVLVSGFVASAIIATIIFMIWLRSMGKAEEKEHKENNQY